MRRCLLLALPMCFACGSEGTPSKPTSNRNNPVFGDPDASTATPQNLDGCSEEAKLVYVLSYDGAVYSFAPAEKKFTKLGTPVCNPTKPSAPVSMAVDRSATGYINGHTADDTHLLFKLDLKSLDCVQTPVDGNYGGMGYSTNGNTNDEQLFVIGGSVSGQTPLETIDFNTNKVFTVATIKAVSHFELTGTGDGRLFGFLAQPPMTLAELDKKTGAIKSTVDLSKIKAPTDPLFAFSFWGGDFYFYTSTFETTTTVSRYRPADGSFDTAYMPNIGFQITGAGVSTCAPVTAPR